MYLLKNSKGVTLTALIITIILLLILVTTATYTGVGTIQSARLTTFNTEMKIIQTKVEELRSNIVVDENGNKKVNNQNISEMR